MKAAFCRYRWIDWIRYPARLDPDGPDYEERVVEVAYDPNRKAQIALTGNGSHLRWIIATENMKVSPGRHYPCCS